MVMRFLYACYLNVGTVTTEIKDIVARFAQDGVGLSLSAGWNTTVRNAIGHATYYLDTQTTTIHFEDRRASSTASLSFDQFRELVSKMFDVGIATAVLLILRVLIPMNFREVRDLLGL